MPDGSIYPAISTHPRFIGARQWFYLARGSSYDELSSEQLDDSRKYLSTDGIATRSIARAEGANETRVGSTRACTAQCGAIEEPQSSIKKVTT